MAALERLEIGPRKFALGRWLGHEALDECRRWCVTKPTSSELHHSASDLLDSVTGAKLQERTSTETAETFLTNLPSQLERILARHDVTDRLITAIRDRIQRHLEAPIDPFQRVYDVVASASESLSGITAPCAAMQLEIYFAPRGDAHEFPVDAQVGGRLAATAAGTSIEIHFTAKRFGVAETRTLPYAMFHEVFVHGLASERARDAVGPYQEGWMDAVAFDVHNAVVQREPPFADLGSTIPFDARSTLRAAQRFHEARRVSLGGIDRGAEIREVGWESAQVVLDRVKTLGGTRETFWLLSMAFNRGDLDPYLRDEACEAVAILLEDEHKAEDLEHRLRQAVHSLAAADPDEQVALADEFFTAAMQAAD